MDLIKCLFVRVNIEGTAVVTKLKHVEINKAFKLPENVACLLLDTNCLKTRCV